MYPPPGGPPKRGSRAKTLLVIGLLIAVVTPIGLVGNWMLTGDMTERDDEGNVLAEGETSALHLRQGDCYREKAKEPDGDETTVTGVEAVTVVPCDKPHSAQVMQRITMSGKYPSDKQVMDRCAEAIVIWAERHPAADRKLRKVDAEYGAQTFMPTRRSWESLDDNAIVCGIVVFGKKKLTWQLPVDK